MPLKPDQSEFWDRVEHDMKTKRRTIWSLTNFLLRGGIVLVLVGISYFIFHKLLTPPSGYFISRLEMIIHPLFWVLIGVMSIIAGAYLRFKAMGPIIERFKLKGID